MFDMLSRRTFLGSLSAAAAIAATPRLFADDPPPLYKISLAQWSLHKALFGGKLDNLDFAKTAKSEFGIDAVEYVNQFFKDKAQDQAYLNDLKTRASDAGVRSLLIMCDGEGDLGHPDEAQRTMAVENHHKWVEAAAALGCHAIRVNAASRGSFEEQMKLAADGLRRLTEFAEPHNLSVIVENHGGLSSNGEWLAGVMKLVDHPHCGTLPDFGNFRVSNTEWYNRYQGVAELMPFAKAVSAKSHDFDPERPLVTLDGNGETNYLRMMKIVLDAGYRGYVGIEYEGSKLDEYEGIRQTKRLLVTVRDALAALY
ncbi:MAG: sugar phosphate isomerase/epimerase [Planctomyces sp.]|nr:sugar phosphate isomerase/epimerase [Planctomyces sp.]